MSTDNRNSNEEYTPKTVSELEHFDPENPRHGELLAILEEVSTTEVKPNKSLAEYAEDILVLFEGAEIEDEIDYTDEEL